MRTPVLAPSLLLSALAVTGCSSSPTDVTPSGATHLTCQSALATTH